MYICIHIVARTLIARYRKHFQEIEIGSALPFCSFSWKLVVMLLMVLQSPFKGSSSSHEISPTSRVGFCDTYLAVVARIVAEWHGRDVLGILMCNLMSIKSEHDICYVCLYMNMFVWYMSLSISFVKYFRHRILQLRYVGSAFLSKRQRSFFNKKASLKARWLRSPSKQVMGFWNQLDWCFNRDLKNRNVPWQIHRNYNKIQCTIIFSKCKLNNILCKKI